MIDIKRAHKEFDHYLDSFDRDNEKIRLKIIHTNEVVRCAGKPSAVTVIIPWET